MSWQDSVNGTYEMAGSFFILLCIIKLHNDKMVRGIHWLNVGFFATWGYWNIYYYPHLGQWWSTVGAIGITAMNTIWLGQLIYYTRKEASEKLDKL